MSSGLTIPNPNHSAILCWESEGGGLAVPVPLPPGTSRKNSDSNNKPGGFAKLRNDNGIEEIQIGMKKFECIGASPPHDHPHVYLNMGLSDAMLCPYCATAFRFDKALAPNGVMPIDSLYNRY